MSASVGTGALYLVSTPIGNLGDITLRALETLRMCDRVLAEDTRRTRQLLAHYEISGKPVERFDAHATDHDVARVIALLLGGERLALVSDAGTPVVSDPGEKLIEASVGAGLAVVPIPGPSALLAALVASGLAGGGRFRFLGFLPRPPGARRKALALACATSEPVVIFESPNRTAATLGDLAALMPARHVCIARELTKVHEEFVRGALVDLARDPRTWRGEIAIVLGAYAHEQREDLSVSQGGSESRKSPDETVLVECIDAALARGEHPRTIAVGLAEASGLKRRDLYMRIVARRSRYRLR